MHVAKSPHVLCRITNCIYAEFQFVNGPPQYCRPPLLRLIGPLYPNKLNQLAVAIGAGHGFAPGRAPDGFGFVAGDAQKVQHPAPI